MIELSKVQICPIVVLNGAIKGEIENSPRKFKIESNFDVKNRLIRCYDMVCEILWVFDRLTSHKTPIFQPILLIMRWFSKFLKFWTSKNLRDQEPCNSIIFQNYNFKPDMLSWTFMNRKLSWTCGIILKTELPLNFRSNYNHITNKNKMIMWFVIRSSHWLPMDKYSQLIFHAVILLMSQLLIV